MKRVLHMIENGVDGARSGLRRYGRLGVDLAHDHAFTNSSSVRIHCRLLVVEGDSEFVIQIFRVHVVFDIVVREVQDDSPAEPSS